MRDREQIQLEGPPVIFPDGGNLSLASNNLRVWTTMENGGTRIETWNGEDDVVKLGYNPPCGGTADIQMAQFTLTGAIGPTASAICSPINMESKPAQNPLSDAFFWDDNGASQNVLATQNDFDDGAGAYPPGTFNTGPSSPKPSNLQMVIGIWCEHQGNCLPVAGQPDMRGVFQTGIGGGDIIWLENLSTGAETWLFAGHNDFRNDGIDPPTSTDWSGGTTEGPDAGVRHKVVWVDLNAERNDTWRISVRPPSYGGMAGDPTPNFNASPDPIEYYVQVYMVQGCALLAGGLFKGDILGSHELPVFDRVGNLVPAASDGALIL